MRFATRNFRRRLENEKLIMLHITRNSRRKRDGITAPRWYFTVQVPRGGLFRRAVPTVVEASGNLGGIKGGIFKSHTCPRAPARTLAVSARNLLLQSSINGSFVSSRLSVGKIYFQLRNIPEVTKFPSPIDLRPCTRVHFQTLPSLSKYPPISSSFFPLQSSSGKCIVSLAMLCSRCSRFSDLFSRARSFGRRRKGFVTHIEIDTAADPMTNKF